MANYKKILFPVDLSETAPKLIDHVISIASKFEAEVHLLYVVRSFESPSLGDYIPGPTVMAVQEEMMTNMAGELKKFADMYLDSYDNKKTAISSGHTGREILNYAEKNNVDMIIMGTHGRTAVGRFFFGSVAQRVVLGSSVPVVVIRP